MSRLVLTLSGFCFFFSSRRRHTRLVSDWSSDVCSSDLARAAVRAARSARGPGRAGGPPDRAARSARRDEIGRASCRGKVEIWGGGGVFKKKKRGEWRVMCGG